MSSIGDMVSSAFGGTSAAKKSAGHAVDRSMSYQQNALQYLMDQEKLPTQYRENALNQLAALYGAGGAVGGTSPGGIMDRLAWGDPAYEGDVRGEANVNKALEDIVAGKYKGLSQDEVLQKLKKDNNFTQHQYNWFKKSDEFENFLDDVNKGRYEDTGDRQSDVQQQMIDTAKQSPLYQAIMGGQKEGEKAIMRNASMTGGLRSGNVQHNLYDYNTQLSNQALLQSYNQQLMGLQGLSGLPSNANAVAGQYNAMGNTIGQGTIAKGAAQQQAESQGFNDLMGMITTGFGMFSDRRLKNNIKLLGKSKGFNLYSWDWNNTAKRLGLIGSSSGFMADEVQKSRPELVIERDGFLAILYGGL